MKNARIQFGKKNSITMELKYEILEINHYTI